MKKLLIIGHGRAGKDESLDFLAGVTHLRNAGTTSFYLAPYVAARLNRSVEDVYSTRHRDRELWKRIGDEVREEKGDPACLIREAFEVGDMTGGVRDAKEVRAAREIPGVLVLWVNNRRAPLDPTALTLGSHLADLVIENHDRRRDLYNKLFRFAEFAGLPMRGRS